MKKEKLSKATIPGHPGFETLKKYQLIYADGSLMKPVYCGISTVWETSITGDEPIYAIFAAGTNRLVILEKRSRSWKEIKLEEVENLYGLFWRMCVQISLQRQLEETLLSDVK